MVLLNIKYIFGLKNFDTNYLTISIHDSYSLLAKYMHNKNAVISYKKTMYRFTMMLAVKKFLN